MWVGFFHDHSKEVKASSILFGLAIVAFLWFAGALAARLREEGQQRLGTTVLGGAAATAGTFLVAAGVQASLAYRIAPDSPAQVKLYSIGILVGFSVGVVIGATAIAVLRSGVFPKWFGFSSAVVAVAVISSGGALVHDGFYAPDGGYALIATAASLVWALVASVLLMRRSGQKEAAAG